MPIASDVMNEAAALLNDPNRTLFTYTLQLPFLRSAWNELQLKLQENGIPTAKEISLTLEIAPGTSSITLPSDFIRPIKLEERANDSSDDFVEVREVLDIPQVSIGEIRYWNWREESIYINPPTTAREVRLIYWKSLNPLNDQNSNLNVTNSQEFLAFRTAALCARFIGENPTRADVLDSMATYHRDILINLEVRKMQSLPQRPKGYTYRRKLWQLQ